MDDNTNLNNTTPDQTTDTTPDTSKDVDNKPEGESNEPKKTFTQEQVNSFLKKEKLKWERNAAKANEAERLKNMSDDERKDAIIEQLTKENEEYKAREAKSQMLKEVETSLKKANIDTSFATFLVTEDADTTKENIDNFSKVWSKALEKAVNSKISGNTPKIGNPDKNVTTFYTLDEIKKMSAQDVLNHKKEVEESLKRINKK